MYTMLLQQFDAVVWPQRYHFVSMFTAVLVVSYGFLVVIDFVPEPPSEPAEANATPAVAAASSSIPDAVPEPVTNTATSSSAHGVAATTDTRSDAGPNTSSTSDADTASIAAKPQRMVIDALDREIPVLNPASRRVADLDAALLDGAVRHPDSADFVREGNIFILGHSSYLPSVYNQNYQAFNGIQNLEWGDTIRVFSADTEYIYRVDRVYEAKASEAEVAISGTGPRLTLATCDSFGSIDDRFVVEAELQSSRPLDEQS